MSAWRRKALEFFTDQRKLVERAKNPMELWIELNLLFENAFKADDSAAVRTVFAFASWCLSEDSGPLPNDTSTAVVCAFYEHLPQKREYWPLIIRHVPKNTLQSLLPAMRYHLGDDQFADFQTHSKNRLKRTDSL